MRWRSSSMTFRARKRGRRLLSTVLDPGSYAVKDTDGSVRYIVQKPMDVTESVRRTREADARLRVALHAADLGSWEYEPDTDIWRRSATVDAIFGFGPGEGGPVAAPFFARMHPDDLPKVLSAVQSALESPDQTVLHFDYRVVDPRPAPSSTSRRAAKSCGPRRASRG